MASGHRRTKSDSSYFPSSLLKATVKQQQLEFSMPLTYDDDDEEEEVEREEMSVFGERDDDKSVYIDNDNFATD